MPIVETVYTREQFDKGELVTDLNRKDDINFRKKATKTTNRKTCLKCERTYLEDSSVKSFTFEGQKVDFEAIQLCRLCFKKFKKQANKATNLERLFTMGAIDKDFIEKYAKKEIPESVLAELLSKLERKLIGA